MNAENRLMHKRYILAVLFFLSAFASQAQKNRKPVTGKALLINLSYNKPAWNGFDKYLGTIRSVLGLQGDFQPELTPGLGGGIVFRGAKAEFEASGAYYMGVRNEASNANKTVTAAMSTSSFDLHFGVNRYIGPSFFIGCGAGLINNGGKLDVEGAPAGVIESTPDKSNPFKGYSWSLKPAAGFFFKMGDNDNYTGIRLSAYYDLGFSKYEFYNNDIFNNRLANYTGSGKSSFANLGFQLGIVIALDN